MATTLSVVDNANGTATATISGSSGGANVVYIQAFTGVQISSGWSSAGSRTGDGTVTITQSNGVYLAYCITDGSDVSGVVAFAVSDGALAVIDRCYTAVGAVLQMLALPCTTRVYDTLYALSPKVQYPCSILTTEGARQSEEPGLNNTDYIGNPVRILVKDVCLQFDDSKKATYRKWRQSIFRAFHNQRLPGVGESVWNKVELGPISEVSSDAPQLITELTVRCVCREPRGIGA